MLIAFTRDTPPYPLSIDGGTDWGKYRISSDAAGLDGMPPHTQPIFKPACQCEEGGGGVTYCTQVKRHQETRTGPASTIPITIIKGIVDNLAVCFMVFPRVFLCLLPIFVLSCCQNTVIFSIYSQKYHHFSISRAFFACSASAITRLLVTFPTA